MTPTKVGDVRVRFAPSPTGPFHIGGARTALFNWLFARQNKGKFVLRIEDTDTERSSKEYEIQILESLKWLGMDWDEGPVSHSETTDNKQLITNNLGNHGPYRQSERGDIYKKYLEQLLKDGRAYYCYCTKEELEAQRQSMLSQGIAPKYGGHCSGTSDAKGREPQVIRFKNPDNKIEVKDIIRGTISFESSLFGDFAIAKNESAPLYNLAVVLDDYEMKISHVIRGEDHLPNTPKQILLQRALELYEPTYAHIPLILSPNRAKLSKRYAESSLLAYRDEGYLPQALVNFIALLGWHPQDNKEIFTREELVGAFELKRVQKAGAAFDIEKLDWLNREHIKHISDNDFVELIKPEVEKINAKTYDNAFLCKVIETIRGRINKLSEFIELAGFFFELPDYGAETLLWGKDDAAKTASILEEEIKIVTSLKSTDDAEMRDALAGIASKYGNGSVLWPLRVALSGKTASPDPYVISDVLGKDEVLLRLKIAREKFGSLL